ncbi:peptidoglycan editing factor PgeF [Alkalibacillus silvisoli]|uniref:Purine nucleoside phosphorylase n=1 Tax=Alkalibacillus silvisoli TaxID=392823 RepID=A0ABN0ZWA6_9BACI
MSEILEFETPSLLINSSWEKYGIKAGFTTRANGFSSKPYDSLNVGVHVDDKLESVLQNRQYISEQIGYPLESWNCLNQVHSTDVINLTEVDQSSTDHEKPKIDADGIFTNDPDQLLVTFYADCVPLYIAAPKQKWVGLAHAGWRGTVGGIGKKMIQSLEHQGATLDSIRVMIGPSITQTNYEVDDRVVTQIPQNYHAQVLKPSPNGRYLLDLKMLNYLYLKQAGLKDSQISMTNYCTYEEEELFYSFRRDEGQTGRMMAFISLQIS